MHRFVRSSACLINFLLLRLRRWLDVPAAPGAPLAPRDEAGAALLVRGGMEFLATREPMVADPFSGQLRRSGGWRTVALAPSSSVLAVGVPLGFRPIPSPITLLPLTVIDLASNGKNDGTIHTSYEAFSDTQVPSCSFQSQGWCVKPRQAFVRCGLDRPKL